MGFNAVEGRYKIRILDENDVLSGDEIYIPNGYMLDMLYNNINNRLYVFFEKTGLNDNYKSLYLNMYNTGDNSYLSTVDLQQNGANTGLQNNIGHNVANSQNILSGKKLLVFNNNQDNMYVLNGNFSNINVIECTPEQAVYHSGYNWISFPRLDRTNNNPVDAQTLLSGINPFPDWLTMWGLPDQSDQPVFIKYENSFWTDFLNTVQSSRGYKLELPEDPTGGGAYVLDMAGTRLDPSTSINIYEGYENWVGYFIPRTQDIFDALGSTADDLLEIYHQDWTCIYTEYPWFDPQPQQTGPKWYCDNQQHNISYGEMVVLKPKSDLSFQWNNPGNPPQGSSTNNPAYYTYEEKADYSAFIIELDTTENPVEIGAFVGDTCIGASSVSASDTLSVIRGYTGGNPGDSVVFEEHYASRGLQDKRVVDYYVYNTEKDIPEKRVIRTGEKRKVFFVSFRNKKKNEIQGTGNDLKFSVYPNPVIHFLNIEYLLPEETNVNISVFDMYGRKTGTVVQAVQQAGAKKIRWGLTDATGMKLKKGVYLIRLKTAYGSAGQKVVIN
ncbi:MAG TPA: T9SS type A sorting domain-containing protein [Bacteroidetes bacterium]|nr:T9SS type A sorting domain-containing protein [Bacteroidota bacterium]